MTAAAAPLMGLLGTVMGMIKTFKLITEFGTGDAKSLSSGISEALVTTELGLVVAISILIIHGILTRMSRGRIGRMEGAAMAFLNGISTNDDKKSPEPEPQPKVKAKAKAPAPVAAIISLYISLRNSTRKSKIRNCLANSKLL